MFILKYLTILKSFASRKILVPGNRVLVVKQRNSIGYCMYIKQLFSFADFSILFHKIYDTLWQMYFKNSASVSRTVSSFFMKKN